MSNKKERRLESPTEKKVKKVLYVVLAGLSGFLVYQGTTTVAENVNSNARTQNIDRTVFNQNIFGSPVILKNTDAPINVVIDTCFTDEQKEIICQAIHDLDISLVGVDYDVILDNSSTKDCVTITKSSKGDTDYDLAKTDLKCPVYKTAIAYPINVTLFMDKIESAYERVKNSKTYEEYLGLITKHEMLHTLGLTDIYDLRYRGKSIMYGYIDAKSPNHPTDYDLNIVNTVYPAKESSQTDNSSNNYDNLSETTVGNPVIYDNKAYVDSLNKKTTKNENTYDGYEAGM